jgi:hypothetical protein
VTLIPVASPSHAASRYSAASDGVGRNALTVSSRKPTPAAVRARSISVRRSCRSASTPPHRNPARSANPLAAATAPTCTVEPVISYTCTGTATISMPMPTTDTVRAMKTLRNGLLVRRGEMSMARRRSILGVLLDWGSS